MSSSRGSSLGLVALRSMLRPSQRLELHIQLFDTARSRRGIALGIRKTGFVRRKSTSAERRNHDEHKQTPRLSTARLFLNALAQSFGNLGNAFRGNNLRTLYRQNPEELVLAIVILVAFAGIFAYTIRIYFTYFNSEQFTRYPPPIAKSLRRALYYSNYKPDPKLALKYYKLALEQCDQHHLDHFSDEVMGIKIQLAAWLEKIGNYDNSAKVLESLLVDCKKWVEAMERRMAEQTPQAAQELPASRPPPGNDPPQGTQDQEHQPETLWGKRTRVLGKAVGISVKLGELYSDEHVLKPELAHDRLTWAVETTLKELHRRSVDGLRDGEGAWMDSEAIGGALEALGHHYEAKSQFHLAVPLFLQALRLCRDPCHSAVLMNNLSASFAQHPIQVPYDAVLQTVAIREAPSTEAPSTEADSPSTARAANLETARRWAINAYKHAAEPKGEERTAECDEACVASLCNLGDIASLTGDAEEARRRFEECISIGRGVGFPQGVSQAQDGLRRLDKGK